jgi:fructose-1,6-bisphosphatase/inositol monophosphatase family enzyme
MDLLADMEHVGGLLASAARLEIMPRFHRLTAASVREKSSSFDVVTEADEAAETVIAEGLRAAFPTLPSSAKKLRNVIRACCKALGPRNLRF